MSLDAFCSMDESRKALMRPFALDGHTYATDGKIAVRVPGESAPEVVEKETADLFPKVKKIIEDGKAAATTWVTPTRIPDMELCETCKGIPPEPKEADCPECGGDGEVYLSNNYHDYQCDCITCDGDGTVELEGCEDCHGTGHRCGSKDVFCGIQGVWLSLQLLTRLKPLPGLRLGLHDGGSLNAHYFTWDGGDGVVLPLRPKSEDSGNAEAHVEYTLDAMV